MDDETQQSDGGLLRFSCVGQARFRAVIPKIAG